MGKGPRYVTSYREKYRRYVTALLCNALLTTLANMHNISTLTLSVNYVWDLGSVVSNVVNNALQSNAVT